ncbi:MAG TPA: Rieske (2Fe-2S) protein [Gemmatimonadaceae bacterium]|nr:Rieske (2Fe-2S) protein [Gemmatimonadaceae bacterium]
MEKVIAAGGESTPCEGCVSRRDFLARAAVLAAAIGVAAACGGAGSDVTGIRSGPLPGGPVTFHLSDYAGLAAVGQPVELRDASGRGLGVAAVRTGDAAFIALGMACTHQGTKVDISGHGFTCPNHGAQFSSTGAVTRGPAAQPLYRHDVVYDATAGTLTVS